MDGLPDGMLPLKKTVEEKADLLDLGTVLHGMERVAVEILANYLDVYEAAPGVRIFEQGEKYRYLCILFEGEVEIRKEDQSAREKPLAVIRHGQMIGEMSLLDGEPRSASGVVSKPALIGVLLEKRFECLKAEHPVVWGDLLLVLLKTVTQRLRRSSGLLVDLMDGGLAGQPMQEMSPEAGLHLLLPSELEIKLEALASVKGVSPEDYMVALLKQRVSQGAGFGKQH